MRAIWRDDGTVEVVNPEGYDPANLSPLPLGYSEQTHEPDFQRRRFVRRRAPFRFPTAQPSIDAIHVRKAIEARALRAGAEPHHWPLVAAEAAAIGVEPGELADQIIARDDDVISAEVGRRRAKRTLSTNGDQR